MPRQSGDKKHFEEGSFEHVRSINMIAIFLVFRDRLMSVSIQELVETEKEYVADLATIVDGYMKKVLEKGLAHDPGKERMVFGNITQIYEWHRE